MKPNNTPLDPSKEIAYVRQLGQSREWHIVLTERDLVLYTECSKRWPFNEVRMTGYGATAEEEGVCSECVRLHNFRHRNDPQGEYEMLRDSIEAHLRGFCYDDDVAEVAIFMEAVEKAGQFVQQVIAVAEMQLHCPVCQYARTTGEHAQTCLVGTQLEREAQFERER